MKKRYTHRFLLVLATAAMFAACSKPKDPDPVTPDPKTPVTGSFKWKEDGGAEITADSAFWTTWSNGTGVRAYKGGMANFFEINWAGANSTAVTTYTLAANGGITFLKGTTTYTNAAKGILNITAFADDKLSGNYMGDVTGGTIQGISITFTDLPHRQ